MATIRWFLVVRPCDRGDCCFRFARRTFVICPQFLHKDNYERQRIAQIMLINAACVFSAWLLFIKSASSIFAQAVNLNRSPSRSTAAQRATFNRTRSDTIDLSSKADDATKISDQFVNDTWSDDPHLQSYDIRHALDTVIKQPCNAHKSSDYAQGENVDPACIMLFQMNYSQHCTRRLPPVNAHAKLCRPDFFILGTRKGGSTSLYAYITSHPNVYHKPVNKGQLEESLGENFNPIGSEAYNREYSGAHRCQYVLDASVSRLVSGAKDLSKYCSEQRTLTGLGSRQFSNEVRFGTEPRFIVLLREPVSKCYSRLNMQARIGNHSDITRNFDRTVSAELKTFLKNTNPYRPHDIITKSSVFNQVLRLFKHWSKFNCLFESAYAMHLSAHLRLFRKSSFRIYFSENLSDPTMSMAVLEDCFKFLGLLPLKAAEMESILKLKYNAAPKQSAARTFSVQVARSIQRAMSPWNSALKSFLGSPLPASWQYSMDTSPIMNSSVYMQNALVTGATNDNPAAVLANERHPRGRSQQIE